MIAKDILKLIYDETELSKIVNYGRKVVMKNGRKIQSSTEGFKDLTKRKFD